jgi:hypothetical protein
MPREWRIRSIASCYDGVKKVSEETLVDVVAGLMIPTKYSSKLVGAL